MSATLQTNPVSSAPAPAPSLTPTLRASGRRAVYWVIAAVGVLLVAILALIITGTATSGGPALGRNNPAPNGGMALAEVLSQQGVAVETADTLDAALDASAAAQAADAGVTLFVADLDGFLSTNQIAQLDGPATHTVIVSPNFDMLQKLAPGVAFGGVSVGGATLDVGSDCVSPAAQRAERVSGLDGAGLNTLTLPATTGGYTGCFDGSASADANRSYVLVQRNIDQAGNTEKLSFVADAAIFANASIIEQGNAALALGLLGENSTLVWYQPTLSDVEATGPPSLSELSPGWVTPVMLLLVLVGIAASIAYGRRFGPLLVENLPVTVRASETMEGRARLYARNSTRLHAIDALRIASVSRLASKLGLARTSTVDEIVAAAASATAQDPRAVRAILHDDQPRNDTEMLALSDRLSELELAVEQAVTPGNGHPTNVNERMEP